MYSTRQDAERAAAAIRQDTAISTTNVRVLPERDEAVTTETTATAHHENGFFAGLRNFFMPEEDRYGYAKACAAAAIWLPSIRMKRTQTVS